MDPSTQELWERFAEEILPLLPAVITFIGLLAAECILIHKGKLRWGKEFKIQKAKELGQVVTATLDSDKYVHDTRDNGYVTARYVYSLDGIHQRKKVIGFKTNTRSHRFPDKIAIYYLGRKIYTDYDRPALLPPLLFLGLPLAAALLVMLLLRPELLPH